LWRVSPLPVTWAADVELPLGCDIEDALMGPGPRIISARSHAGHDRASQERETASSVQMIDDKCGSG